MNRVSFIATAVAVLGSLLAAPVHAAIARTYVASTGSDANAATSCNFSAPCRTFQTALSQTIGGGEILALDGSGYGRIVIDRSVSIIANGGVFAGVGAPAGTNGIEIATAGVKVVLRGLTINGLGGTYGILMTNGATLEVQNCEVSGFGDPTVWGADAGAVGIYIKTAARVVVSDTRVSNSYIGIRLARGANVEIFRVQATGNYVGIAAVGDPADTALSTVSVSDSLASQNVGDGGGVGFYSAAGQFGCVTCSSSMTVTNSVASHNVSAFVANTGGTITASGNRMVGNTNNLWRSAGTFNSAKNNPVSGGTNFGTITNVSATIFQ